MSMKRSLRTLGIVCALVVILGACRGPEAGSSIPADRSGAIESSGAESIDLRTIGYSVGPADATVTVYEFSDFACPFCAMFARGTYPQLHEEFVETGKVRWTYIPFSAGFTNGRESAHAAECAAEQEKFWEMHDLLYIKQNEWKSTGKPEPLYHQYARDLGLDERRFTSCYAENRGAARTAINTRTASALRIRGTPSFYVNGRLVEGALPEEQFRQLLESLVAVN